MKITFALAALGILATACSGVASSEVDTDDDSDAVQASHYPPSIDATQAANFKSAIKKMATESKSAPLTCSFLSSKNKTSEMDLTVKVTAGSAGGPESDAKRDFFIAWDSKAKQEFEVFVSYISFVQPELSFKDNVYTYQFHGALTDEVDLTVDAAGAPEKLEYRELQEGQLLDALTCPLK